MVSRKKIANSYAFLVHSRDFTDVHRKFSFTKKVPVKLIEMWCLHSPPIVVSKIEYWPGENTKSPLEGYIIGIPMTAKQMMENPELAKKRVLQAVKKAEKFGATIVGLGALTSSVTGGGELIKDEVSTRITSGHAYTAFTVSSYVLKAIKDFSLQKDRIKLAVVGAAGSIGSNCAQVLSHSGIKDIMLVDLERKRDKIESLSNKLNNENPGINISISNDIKNIINADIIIAATNAPETVIMPEHLKPGAIIVDDAQPSDISPEVIETRPDVLVVDGGVLSVPNINLNFNFGLASKNNIYSCLGEVLIIAASGKILNYNFNKIDIGFVEKIGEVGKKLDFKIDNYQRLGRVYPNNRILKVKEVIKNN